jgi:Sulfatase
MNRRGTWLTLLRVVLVIMIVCASAQAQTPAPGRPQHAILLVIDGLSYLAPERVDMPNLKALMARGAYFRESYSVVPQHPHSGEWAENYDSSIPNPILVSGTIFLKPRQQFVQSAFFPLGFTAHIANELTYKAINGDFHFTFQAGGNEFHKAHDNKRVDDAENMFWTLTVLRRWKPVYMRVHLQDTGAMGGRSRPNIWAENSPYRQALARADAHLGTLIEELKKLGMFDSTLIFVTGDHGQTVEGGHPPFAQDAWPMPVVVAGPGVKAGGRFPYAEQIDIVPTLTHLMGVKPPDNAMGRIMAEALMNPPANVPPRQQRLKELNLILLEHDQKLSRLREAAKSNPSLQAVLTDVEQNFYDVEKILHWHKLGTVDKLIAHNREVLKRIPASVH